MNNAPTHVLSIPQKTIVEAISCTWYMNIPILFEIMLNLFAGQFEAGLPPHRKDLTLL